MQPLRIKPLLLMRQKNIAPDVRAVHHHRAEHQKPIHLSQWLCHESWVTFLSETKSHLSHFQGFLKLNAFKMHGDWSSDSKDRRCYRLLPIGPVLVAGIWNLWKRMNADDDCSVNSREWQISYSPTCSASGQVARDPSLTQQSHLKEKNPRKYMNALHTRILWPIKSIHSALTDLLQLILKLQNKQYEYDLPQR